MSWLQLSLVTATTNFIQIRVQSTCKKLPLGAMAYFVGLGSLSA